MGGRFVEAERWTSTVEDRRCPLPPGAHAAAYGLQRPLNLGRDLLSSPLSAVFSLLPADAGGLIEISGVCRKTGEAPEPWTRLSSRFFTPVCVLTPWAGAPSAAPSILTLLWPGLNSFLFKAVRSRIVFNTDF